MCGRYANHVKEMRQWADILTDWPLDAPTGYNVAPTAMVPVFTQDGGQAMRWSLIAPWSHEISGKYSTFNARIETLAKKPTFRHAWSQGLRCLIPALGYFEWKTVGGRKQPWFITPEDGSPLVFAGLWEPARAAKDDQSESIPPSCTIITRPAEGEMKDLHPRTPVMLQRELAEDWLAGEPSLAREIAESKPHPKLKLFPVSSQVNNTRHEGANLVEPLMPEQGSLF